ncbi:hypothetical protein F2P81_003193 [Scophthalmus maximus]|uniref:Uncharacterized protein n=1 Tax=Scophthalmus maximus TaxID=52904 RepID=A0A6A4TFM0_SCOMX|nr:hypothetical protein F2P81_003193 [Scophthalmus maximus]
MVSARVLLLAATCCCAYLWRARADDSSLETRSLDFPLKNQQEKDLIDALQEVLEKLRSKEMPLEKKLGWLPSPSAQVSNMASGRVLERAVQEEPRRAATANLDFCQHKYSLLIIVGRTAHPRQTEHTSREIERAFSHMQRYPPYADRGCVIWRCSTISITSSLWTHIIIKSGQQRVFFRLTRR